MKLSDFEPEALVMLVTGWRSMSEWCVVQNNVPLVFTKEHPFLTLVAWKSGLHCVRLADVMGLEEAARTAVRAEA